MALMGIDAGITGCKAVAFTVGGKVLAQSYREYRLHQPQRGWAEIDPRELWSAVAAVISQTAKAAGEPVTALAVSSMGEAAVPVGKDGEPVASIISPIDSRAAAVAEAFGRRVGRKKYFKITGLTPHPCYTVNNVLWLRENAGDTFAKAWKFLEVEDYIGFRLTGETLVGYSMACRAGLFDIKKLCWSQELFAAAELSPAMFSAPVPGGTITGKVKGDVAAELGLPEGASVAAGGHDQPMCAVGAGAIEEGVADLSLGTVECLTNTHKKARLSADVLAHNFPVYCHALPGHYTSLAYNFTSGGLLRWYRDNFAAQEVEQARAQGRSVYDVLFEAMEDKLTEVLVLPHHVGTGTPYLDPLARGAIVNIDLSTTRKDLFLACAQGAVLEMMLNFRTLSECRLAPHTINAIGGGARSAKWLQMRADALGVAINRMDVEEAGCAGAAVLAGLGTGEFGNPAEGCAAFARVDRTFQPRGDRAAQWEELFGKYEGLYEAVKPFRV